MAETIIADVGAPDQSKQGPPDAQPPQDRFTAKFMAHYLQWDAPQVTVEWAASRLVEENANPAVRVLKLTPEKPSAPLSFPELEERCYDLVIINKTGWVVHASPPALQLRAMHTSGFRVHAVRESVKIGSIRPGGMLLVPDAEDGIVLTAFESPATLLIYAFPM